MREFIAVGMHQHVVEGELLARLAFEQIDVDRVAFCDAILSAACFDNCVSHSLWEKSGESPRSPSL